MKYIVVFLFLLVAHFSLDSFWLIVVCCSLGIGLALRFRGQRFPVISILLFEILIGVLFWIIIWNGGGGLEHLARNANISPMVIAGVSIGTNVLIVFLCVSAFYYSTKYVIDKLN